MEVGGGGGESTGARSLRPQLGAPLAVSIEALAVLAVTAVVVELRFSSVVPRIRFIVSKTFSYLLRKPGAASDSNGEDASQPMDKKTLNHDQASGRRKTRSANQTRIHNILRLVPDKDVEGLKATENYEVNSRGVEIFTKSWIPETGKPKAAICFCHGYGDTCTFFFEGIARKLASNNFAMFAMDYAGFGLSGGLHGYIPSFDRLVGDVTEHYASIKKREDLKDVPVFLLGESMGGAVVIKAHLSMPDAWDGAILVAPMCKISEDMYPSWYVVKFLKLLAKIIPKAKLVPSEAIAEIGFQDLKKREQAKHNLIAYAGKPRLGTALSLLRATEEIGHHLDQVSLPFLILHGAADRVTDPAVSRALYEQARTVDKTLHLYEDSWHAVLEGESDEKVDTAISDIVNWVNAHSLIRAERISS